MVTLAISCFTHPVYFDLDLTLQVPMQYCSLQHWILLSPQDISTTGHHFHFGSASSFFLELFLCSSLIAYWTPTDLGGSPFRFIYFCFFILFMGFSRQECWRGLPFPSPVGHICQGLASQGHALQPLHVAGWHAWCPGCPTVSFAKRTHWSLLSV